MNVRNKQKREDMVLDGVTYWDLWSLVCGVAAAVHGEAYFATDDPDEYERRGELLKTQLSYLYDEALTDSMEV